MDLSARTGTDQLALRVARDERARRRGAAAPVAHAVGQRRNYAAARAHRKRRLRLLRLQDSSRTNTRCKTILPPIFITPRWPYGHEAAVRMAGAKPCYLAALVFHADLAGLWPL